MKKILLGLCLISLLTGCGEEDSVVVETQDSSVSPVQSQTSEDTNVSVETKEIPTEEKQSLKFVEVGKLVGEVTVLDDEHLLVENDESLSIYDGDLNLIKDLGNISLRKDEYFEGTFEGGFIYSEPYFYNGYMQEKIGLMDNDGNVLYEPYYFSSEGDYTDCDEYGVCLNERIANEMDEIIYSSNNLQGGAISLVQGLDGLGISIVKTYSDQSFEETQTLVPANYEELVLEEHLVYTLYGTESFMYTELDENFNDRQSVGFKRNGQYGIVDFEGNEVLEPNYGLVDLLSYDKDDQDYYLVVDSSGKTGVFGSKTGWVIEPILSYQDEIKMVNSHIVVKSRSSNSTTVYNIQGDILTTYDDLVEINAIPDWSGENETSDQFYTIVIEEMSGFSSSSLYNNDLKECFEIPSKIKEDSMFYSYGTISDKVIIISDMLISGAMPIYIFEIDGDLIGSFSLREADENPMAGDTLGIDDIIVFNERFMIVGTKVYEIEGL